VDFCFHFRNEKRNAPKLPSTFSWCKPTDEHDDHVDLLALGRQHYGYGLQKGHFFCFNI